MTTFRWGAVTDTGRVRTSNQDAALATGRLFAVADGMGGHAAGEVASRLALDTLRTTFEGDEITSLDTLLDGIRLANQLVFGHSVEDPDLRGMGTTLCALAVLPIDAVEKIAVVNVGDSRVYVVQDGRLLQITRDHSYVEDLVESGAITRDE